MTVEAQAAQPVALIADDERTSRELTRATLESAGFKVVEAGDGVAALAAYAEHLPDLFILDVEMPRMDGISVCRELRRRPDGRYVPIVMATGMEDIDLRVLALEPPSTTPRQPSSTAFRDF